MDKPPAPATITEALQIALESERAKWAALCALEDAMGVIWSDHANDRVVDLVSELAASNSDAPIDAAALAELWRRARL